MQRLWHLGICATQENLNFALMWFERSEVFFASLIFLGCSEALRPLLDFGLVSIFIILNTWQHNHRQHQHQHQQQHQHQWRHQLQQHQRWLSNLAESQIEIFTAFMMLNCLKRIKFHEFSWNWHHLSFFRFALLLFERMSCQILFLMC